MNGLHGKKILLTGAAGGIGSAIARALAQAGAAVALFEKDSETAQAAAQACGGHPFAADLADPQAVADAVAEAVAALGGLDGVVNNAAITRPDDGDPIDTTLDDWEATLKVNLTGAFLICKHTLPHLIENGGGSIVAMSSVVAHSGSAVPQIAYTASKGGLEAMTREIAIRYARDNVRANCIAAGPVLTERNAHYFDTPEKWAKRRRHIPLGRLGTAEEIAALVCFLLDDAASWQTGSVIRADGGISAAYIVDDRNGRDTPE